MARRQYTGRQFWLTWSESHNDWVRRATGETLSELEAEARFQGLSWKVSEGSSGVWFEFVEPRRSSHERPRRRR